MTEMTREVCVPDVGDIVEFGDDAGPDGKPRRYRVTSWLRPHVELPEIDGHDMMVAGAIWQDLGEDRRMEAIMSEIEEEDSPSRKGVRLEWCHRSEATHVCVTGVCGAVVEIGDCRVVGRVDWTPDLLASAQDSAIRLADSHRLSDVWRELPSPPKPRARRP